MDYLSAGRIRVAPSSPFHGSDKPCTAVFGGGPIFIPFAHPGAMCLQSYLLAIIQSPMFAAEYDA